MYNLSLDCTTLLSNWKKHLNLSNKAFSKLRNQYLTNSCIFEYK